MTRSNQPRLFPIVSSPRTISYGGNCLGRFFIQIMLPGWFLFFPPATPGLVESVSVGDAALTDSSREIELSAGLFFQVPVGSYQPARLDFVDGRVEVTARPDEGVLVIHSSPLTVEPEGILALEYQTDSDQVNLASIVFDGAVSHTCVAFDNPSGANLKVNQSSIYTLFFFSHTGVVFPAFQVFNGGKETAHVTITRMTLTAFPNGTLFNQTQGDGDLPADVPFPLPVDPGFASLNDWGFDILLTGTQRPKANGDNHFASTGGTGCMLLPAAEAVANAFITLKISDEQTGPARGEVYIKRMSAADDNSAFVFLMTNGADTHFAVFVPGGRIPTDEWMKVPLFGHISAGPSYLVLQSAGADVLVDDLSFFVSTPLAQPTPTPEEPSPTPEEPSPTPTSLPSPSPTWEPEPTATPTSPGPLTPTPGIIDVPINTIVVTDDEHSTENLVGKVDQDEEDDRALTIHWNTDVEGIKDYHIYVNTVEPANFLGLTGSGEVKSFTWREGARYPGGIVTEGPQFGSSYLFIVAVIPFEGAAQYIYAAAPVLFLGYPEPTIPATATPEPSPTPSPSPTATLAPTVTPTAAPTATPTEAPTPTATPAQVGDLVRNGGFHDSSAWTLQAGWTIADGAARYDGSQKGWSYLEQDLAGDEQGMTAWLGYTVIEASREDQILALSSRGNCGVVYLSSTVGRHEVEVKVTNPQAPLLISAGGSNGAGRIVLDDISFIPAGANPTATPTHVPPSPTKVSTPTPTPVPVDTGVLKNGDFRTDSEWIKDRGWSIADGVARYDGTNQAWSYMQQDLAEDRKGQLYRLEYTVIESSAATNILALSSKGNFGLVYLNSTVGTHSVELTVTNDAAPFMISAGGNNGRGTVVLDNLILKLVQEPTPTPTLTFTPAPTNTPTAKPTNTPTSTPVPEPTHTPTETATPEPTNTSTPTSTPTPTITPTPTMTPNEHGYVELIKNGTFDSEMDWTLDTGWTITNGQARYNGSKSSWSTLQQPLDGDVKGKNYIIRYTVIASSADNNILALSSKGCFGLYYLKTSVGEHEYVLSVINDTAPFILSAGGPNGSATVTLDNISVIQAPDVIPTPTPSMPPTPTPTPKTEYPSVAEEALARVNFHRAWAGIAPMSLHSSLIQSSEAHSHYMYLNRIISHQEDPSLPGFTGVRAWDRAQHFGFPTGNVWEGIGSKSVSESASDCIDIQVSGPFHRYPVLHGGLTLLGYGQEDRYYTVNYGALSSQDATITVYPGENQTDVPVAFGGGESPNPFPGAAYPVGYAVTLFSPRNSSISVQSYYLKPVGGSNLTLLTFMPDSYYPYVFAMAAVKPLSAGTAYEAHIEATIGGKSFSKTWTFRTAGVSSGKVYYPAAIPGPVVPAYELPEIDIPGED